MALESPTANVVTPAKPSGVVANVQALRWLAATLVVLVHLYPVGKLIGMKIADAAMFCVGVNLFFVISGFIMVYSTSQKTPTPLQFIRSRIIRIVPLYWLMTLLVFAIVIVLPSAFRGTQPTMANLLRSLTFIPYQRADGSISPMLFVGWSLNLEMMFYLIFSVSLLVPQRKLGVLLCALILTVVAIVSHFAGHLLGPVVRFMTQFALLYFVLGMLIGLAFQRLPSSSKAARVAAIATPFLIGLMLLLARFPMPDSGWLSMLLPPGLVLLAAIVAERGRLCLDSPLVQLLGGSSYALYLTHPLVLNLVAKIAHVLNHLDAAAAIPVMLISLIAATIVGILAHLVVERPLNRVARRFLDRSGRVHRARIEADELRAA